MESSFQSLLVELVTRPVLVSGYNGWDATTAHLDPDQSPLFDSPMTQNKSCRTQSDSHATQSTTTIDAEHVGVSYARFYLVVLIIFSVTLRSPIKSATLHTT
jgi:hypothetical protein